MSLDPINWVNVHMFFNHSKLSDNASKRFWLSGGSPGTVMKGKMGQGMKLGQGREIQLTYPRLETSLWILPTLTRSVGSDSLLLKKSSSTTFLRRDSSLLILLENLLLSHISALGYYRFVIMQEIIPYSGFHSVFQSNSNLATQDKFIKII